MATTIEKGDAFRDTVDQLLVAAGFRTNPEARVKFKKVDNVAVWGRDEIQGPVRFLFEAKDYGGNLPKSECQEFVTEYGSLVRSGDADQAWLISKGAISPDGKALIDNEPNLQCFTFWEFQRRLLYIDIYLRSIIDECEQTQLRKFYIPPVSTTESDLSDLVFQWIEEASAPPLFILGPYGKGKSTFAMHLAAEMAAAALKDSSTRVPILIRLGEIVDEQSLEGLLGKVLASRYRVSNYHFDTFSTLNRLGRFLIIYDGFDEMKHGMTFPRFQQVFSELMRLDEGNARVVILGRDTAFHDDLEFRVVTEGRQITGAGRDVPDPNRRPGRAVQIRGFTIDEAHTYVRNYLPIRAAEVFASRGAELAEHWLQSRLDHLLAGGFDELLERPVHAQMLCEIASYPESPLNNLTVFDLFDTFVHYLLDREVNKKGRDPQFNIAVRRELNGALAWWLWVRGGASTTTLNDIPLDLCLEAARGVNHTLDDVGLKRELIQGCLIEKAANTIYFGHRSLQEFLVAEYLINTDLLNIFEGKRGTLDRVLRSLTPEIIEFIVAGVQASKDRHERAIRWFHQVANLRGSDVPLQGFNLYLKLVPVLMIEIGDVTQSPWQLWIDFFHRSGASDFSQRTRNTFNVLADTLQMVKGKAEAAQAAATYALARVLREGEPVNGEVAGVALAAMLDVTVLKTAIAKVRGHRQSRFPVKRDENFLLWTLLRNVSVERQGDLVLKFDPKGLFRDARQALLVGFAADLDQDSAPLTIPVQALYRGLNRLKISDADIDAIRPFFTEADTRASISPLEVTVIRRSAN